jgi:sulfate transport system ATP-binding protein
MSIEVRNVVKKYGALAVCDNLSLDIPAGELVALLGPSGSGKTTLLRVIAGIDAPDHGRVHFGKVDVTERPVQERNIGFVFQDYALFDHMTVADNIAFGLSVRAAPHAEIDARVRELLQLVQLDGLAARYPGKLSGGQRQRVALARALAPRPVLLLLDEPFGALDARVRSELRSWLRRLHDELHVTSVFVTHDQEEALEVADRIVVLHEGKIEQAGTPDEVFDHPASEFVMQFLGGVNVLTGTAHGEHATFGDLTLPCASGRAGQAHAYIRRHDLLLRRDAGPLPSLVVTVAQVRRVGVAARVRVISDQHGELVAELPYHELSEHGVERGARLIAHVRTAQVFNEEARR